MTSLSAFTADRTGTTATLSVRNLSTSLAVGDHWKPILRDVSFDIGQKETVAIVGESGSGKSIMSLSVMRLLPPNSSRISGEVLLDGRALTGLSEREMRRVRGNQISMIFQDPMTSLNPLFTVGDQLAETIMWHRGLSRSEALREAVALLEMVRIPNAARRLKDYPHQFSGGMRQRVMIAMAISTRPRLLIADEPTTALDVTTQSGILSLLRDLQDETGMSVMFVTHDMGVVAEIADRTLVMLKGQAVEWDRTEAIFTKRRHPYTRSLLAAIPVLGSMSDSSSPARFHSIDQTTGEPRPALPLVSSARYDKTPVMQVKGLTTRFTLRSGWLGKPLGAVHAVENVSFDLFQGETLAIVGESGCGKSTTGRCITRLTEAAQNRTLVQGYVDIDGFKVFDLDQSALRRMRRSAQMVFQDPFASLNPRKSIRKTLTGPFVEHGLGTAREALDKARSLLDRVGLPEDALDRMPRDFSGGQRQRISIARALMLDPKMIIADEAVAALDASTKAQVCNLLLDLQQELGIAILFISHDIAVVERISHRVAVMYQGEIVEIGPRASVFANPSHDYTRRLMAAVPSPDVTRGRTRNAVALQEVQSTIRPPGFNPPLRDQIRISEGHYIFR